MGLQVKGPRVRRRGDEVRGARVLRVADIDNGEAVAEHMADKGMALVDHDLHPIAAAALVAAADEIDVARRDRDHREAPQAAGFCVK